MKELIWRQGESELGKLMHDFNCTNADDMNYDIMAERLKENPKGVNEMCKALEEMRNETAENTLLQTIKNLMETMKWSAEQAMRAMKIPTSEQEKYKARL